MCQIQYNLPIHQNICEMYYIRVPVQVIQVSSRSPIDGLGGARSPVLYSPNLTSLMAYKQLWILYDTEITLLYAIFDRPSP